MSKSKSGEKNDSDWEGPEKGMSGEMIFTGPDYLRQHRVSVEPDHRFVGEGTMSPEGTSELFYLWRAHPYTPHPRPKSTYVGEIGWSLPELNDFNCSNNGKQFDAFRYPERDCFTEEYQNYNTCNGTYIDANRTPCSAIMRRHPVVRVNSTPAALGTTETKDDNETGNRCGWYAVPNSSFASDAVEIRNNGVNNSFGGTKILIQRPAGVQFMAQLSDQEYLIIYCQKGKP